MPKQDPATLAAALRENLRKRKGQARAPEPGFGPDEEGDVSPDTGGGAAGWVHEGSKKS
jgi:hypothetical protein